MSNLATYVFGHPGSGYAFNKFIEISNEDAQEVGKSVCAYINEYFETSLIIDSETGMAIVPTYILSIKKGGFKTGNDAWTFFEKNPDKGVYLPTVMYLSSFFDPSKGMFWSDESTAKSAIEVFTACVGVPGKSKEEVRVNLPIDLYESIRESGLKVERYIEAKLIEAVLKKCFSLNVLGQKIVDNLGNKRIVIPTPIPTSVSKDGFLPVVSIPKVRVKSDKSKFYSFKIDKRLTTYLKDYLKYSNQVSKVPMTLSKFISDSVI